MSNSHVEETRDRQKHNEEIFELIIKDAEQFQRHTELSSENYFKGAVDFLKWTSTVTLAAMLWIGNNITSIAKPSHKIAAAALICLVASLTIAVLTARRILAAWSTQWRLANVLNQLAYTLKTMPLNVSMCREIVKLHKENRQHITMAFEEESDTLKKYLEWEQGSKALLEMVEHASEKLRERIMEEWEDAAVAAEPFEQPKQFNAYITWHILTLLSGLLLYIFAQTNSALHII